MNAKLRYELGNPFWRFLAVLIFVCAIISMVFGSCKTTKHIERTTEKSVAKTSDTARKTETWQKQTTRSITESYTDSVKIPEKRLNGFWSIDQLHSGRELTVEDDHLAARVKYDSATGKLSLQSTRKQQAVPVTGTRTINEVISEESKKDSAGRKTADVSVEKATEKRDVKRTGYAVPVTAAVVTILFLFLAAVAWKYCKSYIK